MIVPSYSDLRFGVSLLMILIPGIFLGGTAVLKREINKIFCFIVYTFIILLCRKFRNSQLTTFALILKSTKHILNRNLNKY